MSESEGTVTITLVRGDTGLGFNIRGGNDIPHIPGDPGIFVTKIRDDGAAHKDGRLKEGDKILEINNKNVRNCTHKQAVNYFLDAGERVTLKTIPGAAAKLMAAAQERERARKAAESRNKILILIAVGTAICAAGTFAYLKVCKPHVLASLTGGK